MTEDIDKKVSKEIYRKFLNKELVKIDGNSYEELEKKFKSETKKYKKRIAKLLKNSYKMFNNKLDMLYELELLWQEMEFIGLVDDEWVQYQRERLYRELNNPEEFKQWLSYNKDKLKSKINKALKK